MTYKALWTDRDNFRNSIVKEVSTKPLKAGEIRAKLDQFALTANNVSYAHAGDMIGYWQFYPIPSEEGEPNWGYVPVWGFADVIESAHPDFEVGERFYGILPMAEEFTMMPENKTPNGFIDGAPHRKELPPLYASCQLTANEPPEMKGYEDTRCLLIPLFTTSYVLYDYLKYHSFLGAEQVIVGSASSKTGFGLAHMLYRDDEVSQKVISLTSNTNRGFVQKLFISDHIVAYDDIETLDASVPTAFVDMAGASETLKRLHHHFGDNMKASIRVGATHWESTGELGDLPGATPEFFFAPSHIQMRDQELGKGTMMRNGMSAMIRIVDEIKDTFKIEHHSGAESIRTTFIDLLDNNVPPSKGLVLRF